MALLKFSSYPNMEVFLYNSTVCRLCGEENDNGTFLYSNEENIQNISELVNGFLPIKVSDDGILPRTLCPGCTIQLEATVEFINLIINGQKTIRSLYQREKEYKKNVLKVNESEEIPVEAVIKEVNEADPFPEDHPATLQVAGLERPKRKRGRPPKKPKTPEELALEAAAKEKVVTEPVRQEKEEEPTGKRKRRHPERFKEVVQGKELEKIFLEEGVIDKEEEMEIKPEKDVVKETVPKVPEVIGHTESGELVVVVKGKGRGRPKGRLRQTREQCAICGKEFSCSGRYMSHVAQHGPVVYQCTQCNTEFLTRLEFNTHQQDTAHQGMEVHAKREPQEPEDPLSVTPVIDITDSQPEKHSLPDLNPQPISEELTNTEQFLKLPDLGTSESVAFDDSATVTEVSSNDNKKEVADKSESEAPSSKSKKLKCPHCDKRYSSKQSKSLHIKVAHRGERAYVCGWCGAAFGFPRALALHSLAHSRRKTNKGFACDLCGKVLNHPSSVAYHKEAEHAGQRYMCNKCGKSFKHKQLLQRHQLVHSQHRPYACKVCNAKFKTKANLINHQLLHSGVKKFQCEICKQRFAHKTSLTLHIRWHNGQKPFACKICGKAFSQKGNLSEHMRIHTGEKPYRCVHCSRRFTTSSQHRLHLRRHMVGGTLSSSPETSTTKTQLDQYASLFGTTTEAPEVPEATSEVPEIFSEVPPAKFPCNLCGSVLGSERAYTRHKKRHLQPLLTCPHCPKTFVDTSNLNKHKKHVHKQTANLNNLSLLVPPHTPERIEIIEDEQEYTIVEQELDKDEDIIYVTYEVDADNSPAYHIIDTTEEEEIEVESNKSISMSSQLYNGEQILMQEPKLIDAIVQQQLPQVTDEQGNPLHFTMQDGTQLAIASLDGHSLHVITQDGQTIPVEINGFTAEQNAEK